MCDWLDLGWDDWMIIGGLSEELSEDEKEQRQIEKDYDVDQEDEEKY